MSLQYRLKKAWSLWDAFWFAPQNLLGLAFMRVILCGTMLYVSVMRFSHMYFFTDENWMTHDKAILSLPELVRPFFSLNIWSDSLNVPMNVLVVILFALLTVGIGGRIVMMLAWAITMGFFFRNFTVHFGVDLVGSLFLFYMMFTNSCERLSVLNLLRKKKHFQSSDFISSMMIRMIQIQVTVIYAYTGWEKLKGASWWDGTALWSVMANPQIATMDFGFIREIPWIIPILGYLTIIFEIYFPAMVVWHKSRHAWLLMGFAMHMGIGLFMGLMPFATVMVSTYFLFLSPIALEQKIVQKVSRT